MTLNPSSFDALKPTNEQTSDMQLASDAAKKYCESLEALLPEGPDKTYAMRKLREVAMWANIALTRQPDGSPRTGPFTTMDTSP